MINSQCSIPTSLKEARALNIEQFDIILFTGDAYVDHPSFGVAVIARLLEAGGYSVAVVPQPNWRDDLRDFKKLGAPRLFFGVSSGNMDSMVNHYTAAKRLRSDDAYTAGGLAGMRPDYAVETYTKILKSLYPQTPVVIGGIEASLRRLTHYDYWSDKLMPSILSSSGADLLVYGMGDKVMIELAKLMHNGFNPKRMKALNQVAYIATEKQVENILDDNTILLHSFESCQKQPELLGENFIHIETQSNIMEPKRLVEPVGDSFVVINPPYPYLTTEDLDYTYSLPFSRRPHPRYFGKGDISAYEMIKFSVNMHRGCFGGCSFCTISAHQGKFISSRSESSILEEVKELTTRDDFKGYLSDLGGPSANMYGMEGRKKASCKVCKRPSCIYPQVCANLNHDHTPLLNLYEKVRSIKGIKKAFIGSGIRYDMFDEKSRRRYLREVVSFHTSGKLKVAPEHTSQHVLELMRKPPFAMFERLNKEFKEVCQNEGLNYMLVPYFISSHPGCTATDMQNLAKKMQGLNFKLDQVQDFTPTPMTLSSVIYYTGKNPYTNETVFTEHNPERKKAQKQLFFEPAVQSFKQKKREPKSYRK